VGALNFVLGITDKITAPAKKMGGAIGDLSKNLTGLGGITDALDAALPGLGEVLGTVGGVALGIGAAVVGLLAAGAAFALSAQNFKDDALNSLTAVTGTAEAAAATYDQLQRISDTISLSQAKVNEIGTSLLLAGVKQGEQLEASVRAVADLQTVAGAQAASKLTAIISKAAQTGKFTIDPKKLVGTGVKVADLYAEIAQRTGKGVKQVEAQIKAGTLAADVGIDALNAVVNKKLGGAAAKQLLDLDVQFTKFKDNLRRLFENVNVQPFLEALHEVLAIFDGTSESGKALKYLITTVFDSLFKAAAKVLPYVRYALLALVIGALKVYIALKPAIAAIKKMFDGGGGGDATKKTIDFIVGQLEVTAIVIGYVIAATIGWYNAVYKTFAAIGDAVGAMIAWGKQVIAVISGLFAEGESIASNFIDGLIGGITGGVGRVVDAVKGLGSSAMGAIKGVLGIASPSKEMAKLGGHTAAGFAQGVNAGAGDAQGAMTDMVTPPAPSAAPGPYSSGKGGGTYNIEINLSGGATQKDADMVASALAQVLEQLGLEQGAPT
jgi:hypothetical protein